MLAEKHSYTIEPLFKNVVKITIKKIGDDSKGKVFTIVCNNMEGLVSHMESLTDVICGEFMKSSQELK